MTRSRWSELLGSAAEPLVGGPETVEQSTSAVSKIDWQEETSSGLLFPHSDTSFFASIAWIVGEQCFQDYHRVEVRPIVPGPSAKATSIA